MNTMVYDVDLSLRRKARHLNDHSRLLNERIEQLCAESRRIRATCEVLVDYCKRVSAMPTAPLTQFPSSAVGKLE